MLFGYFTLFVAFFLSVVAAYYSVLGLVAIFSAAVIPVMIMGGALETGKVVAAMWLHRNWHRAPWTYKAYLLPSLLALMLLTSMGTFGYLSKAHSDQSLVSGDVTSKIALYDEKIRIAKENIDANRAALKQLDASVDQTLSRSTTEQGAERSVQIRRQQGPERTRLLRDIETEQKKIAQLNEERAPIAAEVRKVEAEVGPIKYIAALLYGDDPEANLLESAVRWVIILIVIVFDPLAIVLILAGSRHLEWERELLKHNQVDVVETSIPEPVGKTIVETETQEPEEPEIPPAAEPVIQTYLYRPWIDKVPGIRVPIQVFRPETTEQINDTVEPLRETQILSDSDIALIRSSLSNVKTVTPYEQINENFVIVDGNTYHRQALASNGYADVLEDLDNPSPEHRRFSNVSFGVSFPGRPNKGQMHVHTGILPSKLYKFNGSSWIEVDKTLSDSYTHNEAYIRFLVEKLETKELAVDDLTEAELNMIFECLKNAQSSNNTA